MKDRQANVIIMDTPKVTAEMKKRGAEALLAFDGFVFEGLCFSSVESIAEAAFLAMSSRPDKLSENSRN